jgi:hypothetical protein
MLDFMDSVGQAASLRGRAHWPSLQVLGEQWSSIRAYELEAHGVMQAQLRQVAGSITEAQVSSRDEADPENGIQASLSGCSSRSYHLIWPWPARLCFLT